MSIATGEDVKRLENVQRLLKEIESLVRPDTIFRRTTQTCKLLEAAVAEELKAAVWENYLSERKGG